MRKFFFCALAGTALLLLADDAHAQRRREVKDSSVTIVFSESTSSPRKRKAAGDENIIKIAPLGFIGGVFPISYERRINDFLSVEVAGGLTNRNYVREAFTKEEGVGETAFPWDEDRYYDEAEPSYNFDYRKPKMGYMYRVMPKFYFDEEAPDGSYVGLQYNFLKYKFSIPKFVGNANGSSGHTGSLVDEHENITDYMVYFGRQFVNNRITIESASGIGIRKVKGMKYVASNNNGTVVDGMAPYSKSGFNFGFTFTIGYHF